MAHHLPRFPVLVIVFLVVGVHVPASHAGPLPPTYDGPMCSASRCGSLDIRYPFYLANATAATTDYTTNFSCGYTDLRIFCRQGDDDGDAETTAIIQLDQHSYTVKVIDYNTTTILLADTEALQGQGGNDDGCSVAPHNVSFSHDWLSYNTRSYAELTFFLGCYARSSEPLPTGLEAYKINCPWSGNPTGGGAALVFSSEQPDEVPREYELDKHCDHVVVMPVLREHLNGLSNLSMLPRQYGRLLSQGFELVWNGATTDQCHLCEQSRGRCAYSQAQAQERPFLGCLCADETVGVPDCRNSSASSKTSGSRRSIKIRTIAGGAAAGISFLLVAGFLAFFVLRKRKQKKEVNSSSKLLKFSGSGGTPYSRGVDTESGSIVQDPQTHLFSYEELEEATDRFNDNRELGDGGFGTVYKGYLKDGRVVAVKRLYSNSYRRVEQFVNEAAILSRLRHPNLVMFYGCTSSSSRELLLVYEFVANGTVADHLHGDRAPERALSWPLRLNIAVESAAALTYLHAIEPPIVHRDVKTTNILLDADFHVKVADFGLSRLFPLDVTHVSTAPQGTPGYVDPEYHQCYQLTDKSDVYSFGVVLVELISSKPAVDITRHRNEINLAGMAINKIQKCQLEQLVDLELGYESDPATKKMMTMVAELAFRCLQQNGEMRPPIKEVLEVLRSIQDECRMEKDGKKDKDPAGAGPFSPNTVHAPWDSRATTPNTSRD